MNNPEIGGHNLSSVDSIESLLGGSSPVEIALGKKALMQLAILEGSYDLTDSLGIEPIVMGIFRVLPTEALIDWSSPSQELTLKKGDKYLDFHIPKTDININNEIANLGYTQIAKYMADRPEITKILGITYKVMALSARRNQGFRTEQLELPENIAKLASETWQKMLPEARPRQFESIYAVWQERQDFIDRFTI